MEKFYKIYIKDDDENLDEVDAENNVSDEEFNDDEYKAKIEEWCKLATDENNPNSYYLDKVLKEYDSVGKENINGLKFKYLFDTLMEYGILSEGGSNKDDEPLNDILTPLHS